MKKWSSQNAATIMDNSIIMPFVNGNVPNYEGTLMGVNHLFKEGFLIGDAKPSNFLKTVEGRVEPVDFGLVFKYDQLECIDDEVKKNIITDYIGGGFRHVPDEIKNEYNACMKKLINLLGNNSPTRRMNRKILSKVGL